MRTIARFMDARNTAEGKFLSVLLSVLLVFSFLNVTWGTTPSASGASRPLSRGCPSSASRTRLRPAGGVLYGSRGKR